MQRCPKFTGGARLSMMHQPQSSISLAGASSSYSDMAVSYEQWPPAAESIQAYYPSIDMGSSYGAAYNVPATSEYGAQQLSVFGDAISQTYVRRVPPRQLFLRPPTLSAHARCPHASLCRSAGEQIPV